MRIHRKLAIAAGAGVAGLGLFGMVALAAFAPDTGGGTRAFVAPTGAQSAVEKPKPQDKLKDLLDGLVAKGVITQTQETTILAAVNDRSPRARVEAVLRDFLSTSAHYLGLSPKELQAKLPGTSLAAIADGTNGKNRAGLVAALSLAGNADIDKALANKRITDDQAKTLRDGLPAKVNEFVDRKWPVRPTAAMPSLNVKGVLGDLLAAGRSYLGVPIADLRSQLAAGKSLGDIANATNGKSRDGLVAALTNAANARIDQAASDKKLTADQTKTLKDKVAAEVVTFVDRKMTLRTGSGTTKPAAPQSPAPASPAPKEDR